MKVGSREVCKAAIQIALTDSREEDGSHIGVCVFFAIGLLNLNDVAIGMGHRVV